MTTAPLFPPAGDGPDTDASFDAANPGLYSAFAQEAQLLLDRGRTHYSARTIVEVLRHHSAVSDGSIAWKINDHAIPYLSRRLIRERPAFAGFFELRRSALDGPGGPTP